MKSQTMGNEGEAPSVCVPSPEKDQSSLLDPCTMTVGPMPSAQRRAYWAALLGRQRASGLTISAFCRSEGVSLARFFYWKRRLAPDAPAPARSGASPVPAAAPLLFSELRLEPSRILGPPPLPLARAGGVEIVTPSGWVVRTDSGTDAAWVARLARVLEGVGGGRAC